MARVRSPAYPGIGLKEALEMIEKVHKVQQRVAEPRIVVLKHMGYSGENGRALKAISALLKYGLLEKVGKDGHKVSDRAVNILYPDPERPDLRPQELLDAARAPALYQEIFDRWPHRPSENSLEAFLIQKGFNLNHIQQVARAFYETFDLVQGIEDSYDSSSDEYQEDDEDMQNTSTTTQVPPKPPANTGAEFINVTKPIFDFETVSINTVITNQKSLSELIGRLETIKSMLPENDTDHD